MKKSWINKCSTKETIGGDPLEDQTNIVSFLLMNSSSLECYKWEELKKWFDEQEKLYYYVKGQADEEHRIYKLPYSGLWVTKEVYDFVNMGRAALFLYLKQKDVPIGSSFGISQTHGEKYAIYTALPIRRSDIESDKDVKVIQEIMKSILPDDIDVLLQMDPLDLLVKDVTIGQELLYVTTHYNRLKLTPDVYQKVVDRYKDQINKEIKFSNELYRTPLMMAIVTSLEAVKILVKNGANVNQKNSYSGNTPLIISYLTEGSPLEIKKFLLDSGADVNAKNDEEETALEIAVFSSKETGLTAVKLLLDNGADVNSRSVDGYTPLMWASSQSNDKSTLKTVKLLLDYGANVNAKNSQDDTSLSLAVEAISDGRSSVKTVRLLLDYGADVNARNDIGWTPLMIAVDEETLTTLDTVALLIDRGADVNASSPKKGITVLMLSVLYKQGEPNLAIVTYLLDHGADVYAKSAEKKRTAFELTKSEAVKKLLKEKMKQ